MLTPLAVDPAHPFPYISGLSLNLAITVQVPETGGQHFARIKVPDNVDRFVRLRSPDGTESPQAAHTARFLPMEELIAAHLSALFPGLEIVEHHAFRITRNADFEVEEDRDEDLLQALERELARRRFGSPVRLEVADDMTEHMLELLLRELDVDPGDVVQVPGLLDLSCLWQVYGVDRPALKDPTFVPATHPAFGQGETPRASSPHCGMGMCSCITRMTRSPPACNDLSNRPPRILRCWPSSRRCIAPPATLLS